MYIFEGHSPSELYVKALGELLTSGQSISPRGKLIKEIRPVVFAFENPTNNVTFMRRMNPFFQLSEALWILSGRSDVDYLKYFNSNIAQFSDDGEHFNASYGERLRFWNKNQSRDFIYNPLDQLFDVYQRLKEDPDTRQAMAVIWNPLFDNIRYTRDFQGKDIPCNVALDFKLRNNRLDLTVFNRSNDIHWGLFGANLAQFSNILLTMAAWLGVKVGTYYHFTDSLHVYLEDYSYKCTKEVLDINSVNSIIDFGELSKRYNSRGYASFSQVLSIFWETIGKLIVTLSSVERKQIISDIPGLIKHSMGVLQTFKDEFNGEEFIKEVFLYNLLFICHKEKEYTHLWDILNMIELTPWKVACCGFMWNKLDIKDRTRLVGEHWNGNQKVQDYLYFL
jgi:thymidylate synthase